MQIKTIQADTFDKIAYRHNCNLIELMRANPKLLSTFIFKAGTEIIIPDTQSQSQTNLEWYDD